MADITPTAGAPVDVLGEAYGLTRSEARVALLLAEGCRNRVIADRCAVTEFTARRHTEKVFVKLGVHRREAVRDRVLGALQGSRLEPAEQVLAAAASH